MRKSHIIGQLTGNSIPEHCIFFDTETEDLPHIGNEIPSKLKIFTAVYHRQSYNGRDRRPQWTDGTTEGEFFDFVIKYTKSRSKLCIFSANVWFDIRHVNILNNLLYFGYSITGFFDRGRTFYLALKKDKSTIVFINMQNIIPFSVAGMGKMLGYEKDKVDFETVTDEDLLKYCYKDTEIIYKTMLQWFDFITNNDLGTFRPTLASQSLSAYTHRFITQSIFIHDNEKSLKLERNAYQGGRSESRYIGKVPDKQVHILDINSQYPFVMQQNEFPYKLIRYRSNFDLDNLYKLSNDLHVCVRCNLQTDEPVYGHVIKKRLCFPIGKFTQVLCTPAFRYAYERNHIHSISEVSFYEKAPLFNEWVTELYKARLQYKAEGNSVYETLIKLIMNSLYGKFGQRGDEILLEENVDEIGYKIESVFDADIDAWIMKLHIGDFIRESILMTEEGFNSFPAIAAHVTEYARMYLWKMIKKAGLNNVYYMDTDSLFVNDQGLKNLECEIDNLKLGKLKLVKTIKDLTIYGVKDYVADETVKHKGVPKTAKQLPNNTFQYLFFPGLRTDIRTGIDKPYMKKYVKKILKRIYTKGHVHDSGFITPFELDE